MFAEVQVIIIDLISAYLVTRVIGLRPVLFKVEEKAKSIPIEGHFFSDVFFDKPSRNSLLNFMLTFTTSLIINEMQIERSLPFSVSLDIHYPSLVMKQPNILDFFG